MRHLIDALGRDWQVYERGSSVEALVPGRPSLVFDTEGIVRRLWHYPAEWAELPDELLLGLMEQPYRARQKSTG
jgi:hypothetical protein